jgi:hypothetical protein
MILLIDKNKENQSKEQHRTKSVDHFNIQKVEDE